MNEDASKTKKLFINLIVAIIAYIIVVEIGQIIYLPFSDAVSSAVGELIMFAVFLVAAIILKKQDCLKFKTKGFGISIVISLFILLRSFLAFAVFLYKSQGSQIIGIPAFDVICFVLYMLLIGMSEELLFRGIIQGSLHDFFGTKNRMSVRLAIIIASLIFGCIHFTNVFTIGVSFDSALIQVISAAGAGFIFGTMYYRSGRNIWACILIHAFNDFVSLVASGSLQGATVADNVGNLATSTSEVNPLISMTVITGISFLIFLFCTRKKVVEK